MANVLDSTDGKHLSISESTAYVRCSSTWFRRGWLKDGTVATRFILLYHLQLILHAAILRDVVSFGWISRRPGEKLPLQRFSPFMGGIGSHSAAKLPDCCCLTTIAPKAGGLRYVTFQFHVLASQNSGFSDFRYLLFLSFQVRDPRDYDQNYLAVVIGRILLFKKFRSIVEKMNEPSFLFGRRSVRRCCLK